MKTSQLLWIHYLNFFVTFKTALKNILMQCGNTMCGTSSVLDRTTTGLLLDLVCFQFVGELVAIS